MQNQNWKIIKDFCFWEKWNRGYHIYLTRVTNKPEKICEAVFLRHWTPSNQYSAVIPKRGETNEVIPMTGPS